MAAGLVMVGWPILVFWVVELGIRNEVAGVLGAVGCGAFGFFAAGYATLRRVRARKVEERLLEFEATSPKFVVDCHIDQFLSTGDSGILWREGDVLRFEGIESGFSVPSDAISEVKPESHTSQWDAQFSVRKGAIYSHVFLRTKGENRSGFAQFIVDWKFSHPYQGGEAEMRAIVRTRRPNLRPFLTFIVPCLPLAIYLVVTAPDHRLLFVPYTLFVLFGFCRYWIERRRLLASTSAGYLGLASPDGGSGRPR
jgi:hypothetical protein